MPRKTCLHGTNWQQHGGCVRTECTECTENPLLFHSDDRGLQDRERKFMDSNYLVTAVVAVEEQ